MNKMRVLTLFLAGVICGCPLKANAEAISTAEAVIQRDGFTFTESDNGNLLFLKDYADKKATEITIPAEVDGKQVVLSDYCFRDCPNVINFYVDGESETISSIDGVLIYAQTVLFAYPQGREGDYTLPDDVQRIGQYACSGCKGLTEIAFPERTVDVESYAFENCTALTEVNGTVCTDFCLSFQGCSHLKSITLGGAVLPRLIVKNMPGLEKIDIAEETLLNNIGMQMYFSNNPKLQEIYFPENQQESIHLDNTLIIEKCPELKTLKLPVKCLQSAVLDSESAGKLETLYIGQKTDVTMPVYQNMKSIVCLSSEAVVLPELNGGESVTVYGSPECNAQKTCAEKEISFRSFGDVNADNQIDILDVITLNKAMFGKVSLNDYAAAAADINKDGKPDASDSLSIMRYIVKLDETLG